ncbi:uncharacterized protein MELLADRAFT_107661 [Melampsora larici-populina 98AG31]|uniref:Uncharacterized protein n=1 Tax=Melampsora larici-populina (strain 98AG31 / pathotype 3-4-7) TaxID=747676 RepID=F4RQC5_MELLP|nr:uncharacterized protein MELLADRAFT_107661 [Melampsora larici-populina 98AG31]EGG05383.1 hypothetical protein MELLADRAFT_107661 [Melampsora larici-populina 98AG31]
MSTESKSQSTNNTLTAQDILEARENLSDEIKFDHLSTNGSNFIDWKKNTARAIKALIGIKNYWDEKLPVSNYLDRKRDALAASVINNTIHATLKNVTDDADSAYEAMEALQNHFRKGGRTAQFSLFNRLINLRLDLNETEMINHMSKVDVIVAEIESTGFIWNSDSIKGLFYQIVMPPEMTKEINKDLDNKYDKSNPNYKLKDVKSAIQIYLARERTATETITINNISTQMQMMAVNSTPRSFTPSSQSTPIRNYQQNQCFATPNRLIQKIDPIRWQRGPPAWTKNDNERKNSVDRPLDIPSSAVGGVKAGLLQCFFCGSFGHTYSAGGCKPYDGNRQMAQTIMCRFCQLQRLLARSPPADTTNLGKSQRNIGPAFEVDDKTYDRLFKYYHALDNQWVNFRKVPYPDGARVFGPFVQEIAGLVGQYGLQYSKKSPNNIVRIEVDGAVSCARVLHILQLQEPLDTVVQVQGLLGVDDALLNPLFKRLGITRVVEDSQIRFIPAKSIVSPVAHRQLPAWTMGLNNPSLLVMMTISGEAPGESSNFQENTSDVQDMDNLYASQLAEDDMAMDIDTDPSMI